MAERARVNSRARGDHLCLPFLMEVWCVAELVRNSLGVVGEVRFSLEVEARPAAVERVSVGGSSGGQLEERERSLVRWLSRCSERKALERLRTCLSGDKDKVPRQLGLGESGGGRSLVVVGSAVNDRLFFIAV